MHAGRFIFSQLMDFVPKYEFDKCVRRYGGNHRVRTFSCYDQFLCMAFGQLTYRELTSPSELKSKSHQHTTPPTGVGSPRCTWAGAATSNSASKTAANVARMPLNFPDPTPFNPSPSPTPTPHPFFEHRHHRPVPALRLVIYPFLLSSTTTASRNVSRKWLCLVIRGYRSHMIRYN